MTKLHLALFSALSVFFIQTQSAFAVTPQYVFRVNLYKDSGGAPGAQISDDTVRVGDSFFLEITALDTRDPQIDAQGLEGLGVRLQWDPQVLKEIDDPFKPDDPASPLVTSNFPMFRSGYLSQEHGSIDLLHGLAFSTLGAGRVIGIGRPERFSLMKFQALAKADRSPFSVRPRGVGFLPMREYTGADLDFENQTITVLEAAPPPGANLILRLNLLQDKNGAPGAALSKNVLRSGESFFAEVTAQDSRSNSAGVIALPIDVSWDALLLEEIDAPWNPQSNCNLVTCAFPHVRGGTLDNSLGMIKGLRGGGVPASGDGSRAIGRTAPERFSLLRFRTRGSAGSTSLTASLAGSMSFADAARLDNVVNADSTLQVRQPQDVNADDNVTPLDALILINYLNSTPAGQAPAEFDVSGDGTVTALDVLQVINYINSIGISVGEGEGPAMRQDPFVEEFFPARSTTGSPERITCPSGERDGKCYDVPVNRPILGSSRYLTKLSPTGRNLLLKAPSDGWDISVNVPKGASLARVYSPEVSTLVVRASGAGKKNCYRLRDPYKHDWKEPIKRKLAWLMKFKEAYEVKVSLQTTKGAKVLKYTPDAAGTTTVGNEVRIGLGRKTREGGWVTMLRDLTADLKSSTSNSKAKITNVNSFSFCGSGEVADVKMR